MSIVSEEHESHTLDGVRIALVGKLAGMSRRDAQQLIRQHGGVPVERAEATVELVVIGEEELPLSEASWDEWFDAATRQAVDEGRIRIITETQLWQRLGLVEAEQHVHRLYTPGMLADLLDVPVSVVRRWHRRGLIVPSREVRRLPYFDFQEVATARRLAQLLAAGMSARAIERQLADLARYVPGVDRPLAQLSVMIEGKHLLLRQGDGLIEPGGQLWFDFDMEAAAHRETGPQAAATDSARQGDSTARDATARDAIRSEIPLPPVGSEQLLDMAASLEDADDLKAAAEMYRAALAAGGPNAQVCFTLAELLYRLGDLSAARERYFMAIELDENYVEARANLGCVLAELGEPELAIAAFQGALAYHQDYPDVHYHLARTLDDLSHADEANAHWRKFLELAPESPWAAAARLRLIDSPA